MLNAVMLAVITISITVSMITFSITDIIAILSKMTLSTEIQYQCVESYYTNCGDLVHYAKCCYAGVITISITTLIIMTVSIITISMT